MEIEKEYQNMSDEEIVGLTLSEQNFFGHIIERYEAKLSRYITRLGVHNLEDRADVLQEIFIKVFKNLNTFDRSLSFSSWIYRIAHNETISWYRKLKVRPEGNLIGESDDVLGFLKSSEDGSDVVFDREVNAEELNRALLELEEKYRDVLLLRYFEHKEYSEISDILKIPTGSVGTLIHRGKRQLYDHLNHEAIRI